MTQTKTNGASAAAVGAPTRMSFRSASPHLQPPPYHSRRRLWEFAKPCASEHVRPLSPGGVPKLGALRGPTMRLLLEQEFWSKMFSDHHRAIITVTADATADATVTVTVGHE